MEQIGRYRITGELGRGAMGIVYKAQDPTIGRLVAIKSIRLSDLSDDAERARLRDRLFREAQSAGILSHPNIVTIYDVAEEGDMAYIFMELVSGPSLDKKLTGDQPPSQNVLLAILRQTAAALDYAHKKGIVHRDIKPANIMIHEDGTAKITDFGVAKIVSQQMTHAGNLMGTPSYMSPEQIQGGAITGAADQFSLAVIAYEFLAGKKPFAAENLPSLLFKIAREEPAPLIEIDLVKMDGSSSTAWANVQSTLQRALSKNPLERFDSCSEFVEAFALASQSIVWKGADLRNGLAASSSPDDETLAELGPVLPLAPISSPEAPLPTVSTIAVDATITTITPAEIPLGLKALERALDGENEPSHTGRNVALALIPVAMIGIAVFYLFFWPRSEATLETYRAPVAAAPSLPAPPAASPEPTPTQEPSPDTPATPVVQATPAPTSAGFRLTSNPTGAAAVFDGEIADGQAVQRCITPCALDLPLGRHSVTLERAGYRGTQRIFTLPDEPGLIVNLEATTGSLNLVTTPIGLTVFIDGQEQRQKTPSTYTLSVGTHQVQVIRGAEKQEITVDIRDGVLTQKNISWAN